MHQQYIGMVFNLCEDDKLITKIIVFYTKMKDSYLEWSALCRKIFI